MAPAVARPAVTMQNVSILKKEVQALHALEGGLVSVFDQMDGRFQSRKAAMALVALIEISDRHLTDLDRICAEEGWSTGEAPNITGEAWQAEAELLVLDAPASETRDALGVALLRRAVHLRIPCYESARLFAFYAERPMIARTMRLALEDEYASLERLRSAAELGVNLHAALGGPSAR